MEDSMGNITQNKSTQNGKQYRSNYHLSFILPTGPLGATIPNTKNNKALAELILKNGTMIEEQAWRYPDAQDWEQALSRLLGIVDTKTKEDIGIASAFEEMIADKRKHQVISERTATTCYCYAKGYLLQAFGNKPLDNITRQDKATIHQTFESSKLTAGGINNYSRTINTFLQWCVHQEYINKVPFTLEQIKQPDLNKKSWIAPEVFDAICQHSTNPIHVSYWRVSYILALRKGELNPDKSDTMYNGLFHQCKEDEKGNLFLEVHGKNQKIRRVPLVDELMEDYVTILQHRLHPSTISQSFKKAAISAGYPQFHFHHTRHSAISNLLKGSKGNLFWVSKFVGHSKVETTMQYLRDEDFAWEMILENKDVFNF